MKLYDEAIEEAIWHGEIEGPQTVEVILKALERAKKEHELLGLYREFMANLSGVMKGEIQPKDIDERMTYLGDTIDKLEEGIKNEHLR